MVGGERGISKFFKHFKFYDTRESSEEGVSDLEVLTFIVVKKDVFVPYEDPYLGYDRQ